jgi:hypothetical protein
MKASGAPRREMAESCSMLDTIIVSRWGRRESCITFFRFKPLLGLTPVAHDVDDDAVGIPYKKSSNALWLIGQGIHNRVSLLLCGCVASVDVADLDADIRMRFIPGVRRHDADLRHRVGRRSEGDDPAHVHGCVEPKNALVKRLRGCRIGRVDVRDNSSNAHGRATFGFVRRPAAPACRRDIRSLYQKMSHGTKCDTLHR